MDIILSIHPKWINKIRSGEKTVELRKRLPKNINRIFVYATSPVKKIIGIIYIKHIIKSDIFDLYDSTIGKTGCSDDEFLNYFLNSDFGYGIVIDYFQKIKQFAIVNPPQSFKYCTPDILKNMCFC